MAIIDQFVTSFSELYVGESSLITATSAVTDVRDFFIPTATTLVLGSDTATVADGGTTPFIVVVTDELDNLVYFTYSGSALAAGAANFASVEALNATTGFAFRSAQIPLVMEIGTLSNEATVIDTPTFGELYRGKLRGQLDGGQLDTQLYWAPRNFVHSLLRSFAENGTAVSAGIRWLPTANAAVADTELVAFESFVSSFGIDTTFDDVAKVSSTFVVDGREHFASGA